ncbi:MAG TPA: curli assembly protein CsgF, partial [Ignavibacteriaceae bacterium]|nr:curli assembly protein CsgF [Ignavibacteriaceae bacterium]
MKKILLTGFIVVLFSAADISAQQLIYTPVNPSFGGYYFNGQTLLSEAQAQNGFTAGTSSAYNPYSQDPLQNFKNSLNQQVLSQLSRQLLTNVFGEAGLTAGHYDLGDYSIDITPGGDG